MQQALNLDTPTRPRDAAWLHHRRSRVQAVAVDRRDVIRSRSQRILPLIAALMAGGALLTGPPVSARKAENPPPGRMVDVGGYRLHLNCWGYGQPTVVLEAGLGGNSLDWARVQPGVARLTRTCAYDRAGYGWSENGPLPRTSARLTEELDTLLDRGGITGPYVIVGHSFGGLIARHFASRYPQTVAGLVLVDASHEDQFGRHKADAKAMDIAPSRLFMRANRPVAPTNLPRHVLPLAHRLASTRSAYVALQGEIQSLLFSAQQLQHTSQLTDIPLVVISRGRREWPDTITGNRMEQLWEQLQQDFLTKVPNARVPPRRVIAPNSGHYIHLDEPEIVVIAVRQIVTRVRSKLGPAVPVI